MEAELRDADRAFGLSPAGARELSRIRRCKPYTRATSGLAPLLMIKLY